MSGTPTPNVAGSCATRQPPSTATTPVAAVESATTDAQVVGRWTLAELADAVVHSPAVIVIGAVAAFEFVDVHLPAMSDATG